MSTFAEQMETFREAWIDFLKIALIDPIEKRIGNLSEYIGGSLLEELFVSIVPIEEIIEANIGGRKYG